VLTWLQTLLTHYGYWIIFFGLFLNNLGVPGPGNTLLLGAGLMVTKGVLSLPWTLTWATLGVFMGTNCGYWLGQRYGFHLLEKFSWLQLTHKRIRRLEHFFKRYGAKGVFFARFVTLFHPIIGLLAGIGKTPKGSFLAYNLAGSALYALLYTMAGDYFGKKFGLHAIWKVHTILYLLVLVIVIALLVHFWRHRIFTIFGFTFYKVKAKGFWDRRKRPR
jgi:membrane protein DedA with SNARE-associated domain